MCLGGDRTGQGTDQVERLIGFARLEGIIGTDQRVS
jgi:hypothetical protein